MFPNTLEQRLHQGVSFRKISNRRKTAPRQRRRAKTADNLLLCGPKRTADLLGNRRGNNQQRGLFAGKLDCV